MKIAHYRDVMPSTFNNETVKNVSGRVLIGKEDGAPNFCMRMFEVDEGGYTPRHSHEWEHEIFIHSGLGELFSNSEWIPVSKGSMVFIPGNEEHQIKNSGTEPLVFICLIPSGAPEL